MNKIANDNSHQMMKKMNRVNVLTLLHDEISLSRVDIAKRTGLTKQTVTNIVHELLDKRLVVESGERAADTAGRRPTLLLLNRKRLLAGGIELTRSMIRYVLMNNAGDILLEGERAIAEDSRGEHAVAALAACCAELLAAVPGDRQFVGIGIGVQGVTDRRGGRILFSKSTDLYDYPLRERLRREFAAEVIVDHRVRAFATGEIWRRKNERLRNVLCIYMNEGVGGAVILNGRLYEGADQQAGKIGHMKVVPGGKLCYCGQRGCLVAYIATTQLVEQADADIRQFDEFVRLLEDGKERDRMAQAGRHLGFALGNAVNLFNPDAVIMGGELVRARRWFYDTMLEEMEATASVPGAHTPVLISEYRENNCCIGAAAMAFYQWVHASP